MKKWRNIHLPDITIIFILLVYIATDFYHHRWTIDKGPERGVIKWDIISYYAYLPATFIYKDLKLDFVYDPEFKNDNKIWFTETENGGRLIITSMGLAIMYSPFFFMAHALAPVFGEPRTGYSSIYQFFIVFGALFYVIIGLFVLKKILMKYFDERVTALTLLAIGLGTNLYYYATYEAAMSHSFNFTLLTLFFYVFIRWYEKQEWLYAILTGLLMGLITLVRPTNVLVFIVFFLWGVFSWKDFLNRLFFYIRKFHLVLLMLLCFLLVWLPQFLYWKYITGEFFFYSYGPAGGRFYFDHPHISEMLIGYRKGWFLYTPLMLIAVMGIFFLIKKMPGSVWAILLFLLAMIYVQSSWWAWYFGGGFGGRAFIDMYGIMALPLAAIISKGLEQRHRFIRISATVIVAVLVLFQVFQTTQYYKGAIHYTGMTKTAYWETFLKLKTTGKYWQSLTMPDPQLARKGIYVYYLTGEDKTYLKKLTKEEAIDLIIKQINEDRELMKDIERYAKRAHTDPDEAIKMVADRIYEYKKDW